MTRSTLYVYWALLHEKEKELLVHMHVCMYVYVNRGWQGVFFQIRVSRDHLNHG